MVALCIGSGDFRALLSLAVHEFRMSIQPLLGEVDGLGYNELVTAKIVKPLIDEVGDCILSMDAVVTMGACITGSLSNASCGGTRDLAHLRTCVRSASLDVSCIAAARGRGTQTFACPEICIKFSISILLFSQRLGEVRLRQEHRGLKTRAAHTSRAPPYGPRPEDAVLFERIRPFQEAALDTLARHGFFSAEALEDGWVVPGSEALPGRLGERIKQINTDEADLMKALGTIAAGYALDGTNGLKDRTGLLEHRYDAV